MTRITEKDRVDSLIEHFWENGYLTLSRKHGKYLPKPSKIGEFEVDAVGKQNKKFVLGVTLSEKDIEESLDQLEAELEVQLKWEKKEEELAWQEFLKLIQKHFPAVCAPTVSLLFS